MPGHPHHSTGTDATSIHLRPYNLKELAALYGISPRTLVKWLKPLEEKIGRKIGYYYNIPQVRVIFSFLGFPSLLYDKDK